MTTEYASVKPLYDITMSKRTRKPLNLAEAEESFIRTISPTENDRTLVDGDPKNDRVCLKQLMNTNGKAKEVSVEQDRSRFSLGQHFTEEGKQLQLVIKKQEDGSEGVKLKRILKRYIKAMSHMIKVKREPQLGSQEKTVVRLKL